MERTLSPREVAEIVGVSYETILAWARDKEIAHVKIGRRVRFTEKNVTDFITANTVSTSMGRTDRSRAAHKA